MAGSVFSDNTIGQSIRWCSLEKRRCYECHTQKLSDDTLTRFYNRVSQIDFDALQPHEDEHQRWTDARSIELLALKLNCGTTLPPFWGYYADSELDVGDLARCSSFRNVWFDLRTLLPRDLNPYKMEDEEPWDATEWRLHDPS